MRLQSETSDKLQRFIKLIPKGDDKTLKVLKAHLLIEELLAEIVTNKLTESNPLSIQVSERMTFYLKLTYCWALVRNGLDADLWGCIKELNSIRNSMAHKIEPKDIDKKISSFTQNVSSLESYAMPDRQKNKLEYSLAWLYIVLSEYLHEPTNS